MRCLKGKNVVFSGVEDIAVTKVSAKIHQLLLTLKVSKVLILSFWLFSTWRILESFRSKLFYIFDKKNKQNKPGNTKFGKTELV